MRLITQEPEAGESFSTKVEWTPGWGGVHGSEPWERD